MSQKNQQRIEDTFRDALGNHEMPVSPRVWESLQGALAQGAASAAATATGSAFVAKAAAVIGMAALIAAASVAEYKYQQADSLQDQVVIEEHGDQIESGSKTIQEEGHTAMTATGSEEAIKAERVEQNISHAKNEVQQNLGSKPDQSSGHEETSLVPEQLGNGGESELTPGNVALNEVPEAKPAKLEDKVQVKPESREEEEAEVEEISSEEKSVQEAPEKTMAYFTHSAEQVITPNGDPFNEYFEVDGHGVKQFYIRFMTRNGQVVYESRDLKVQWNGVDRFGNALPAGVYYFEIQAIGTDDLPYLEKNAKGSVTIVRN